MPQARLVPRVLLALLARQAQQEPRARGGLQVRLVPLGLTALLARLAPIPRCRGLPALQARLALVRPAQQGQPVPLALRGQLAQMGLRVRQALKA